MIYDTKTHSEIKRLNIGHGAAMLMDAVGNRAFISCTPDNYIAVIDLKTFELVRRLNIGGRPDEMAFGLRP